MKNPFYSNGWLGLIYLSWILMAASWFFFDKLVSKLFLEPTCTEQLKVKFLVQANNLKDPDGI